MSQRVSIDLTPVLREVREVGVELSRQMDVLGGEVGRVRSDLQLTSSELKDLRNEFQRFVQDEVRRANVQQSETRIVNLKAQLDREFGHYSQVRRTSIGMLQAFDVGNVTHDTVQTISEELMIQSPRYWLAPALVALAAWSRDEQEICEKSLQEAFSRDKNKTSLLFALILRRQDRTPAAVRWLRHYVSSLDPTALTREFAVILEASSYDAFGPQGQQLMSGQMADWCTMLRDKAEIVEAQVGAWQQEIADHRQRLDQSAYREIAELASGDWRKITQQIEAASALPKVIEKYEQVRDTDRVLPTVLEDLLDDILDQLVTEYDEEELPLRREVVFHEAVIDKHGDLDLARQRADGLQAALEETSDVITMQTRSAISPDLVGVGAQTQRIAVGVGAADFRSAVGRYAMDYRNRAIGQVTYDFTPKHSNYASTYNFQGCRIDSVEPEDAGIARLRETWAATFATFIDSISFKNMWYLVPSLIAFGITLVLFFINPVVGLIGLVIGGAVVYLMGMSRKTKADAEVARARQTQEAALEHSVALYRDANAQLVDARLIYEEFDAFERNLLQLINTWPTAAAQEGQR